MIDLSVRACDIIASTTILQKTKDYLPTHRPVSSSAGFLRSLETYLGDKPRVAEVDEPGGMDHRRIVAGGTLFWSMDQLKSHLPLFSLDQFHWTVAVNPVGAGSADETGAAEAHPFDIP